VKKNGYSPPVLSTYPKGRVADGGEPFSEDDVRMIRREQERRRNEARERERRLKEAREADA
jgi:hypothetical protein